MAVKTGKVSIRKIPADAEHAMAEAERKRMQAE